MDIETLSHHLFQTSSEQLTRLGEERALHLFHKAAHHVPAYRDFLQTQHVDPEKITTIADFEQVPPIDKENYITRYPLPELSWDGHLKPVMFSTSSGTSGEPYFWPRTAGLEAEVTSAYEHIFKNIFRADQRRTLVVVAYSMGTYVAGTFTLNSLVRLAEQGYPITTITPGIHKNDSLKIISKIGSYFDQVVLCAYPPLIKDIIDDGPDWGIDWHQLHLRFISGGESFSEAWREHVYGKAGVPEDEYYTSFVNTYGSADAAILGHETPLSVFVRRAATANPTLSRVLFGEERVPSLHQYYPFWKHISLNGPELLFTTDAGIPLVRYNIHDVGGIRTFDEVQTILAESGQSIEHLPPEFQSHHSFVFLYGRKGAVATLYGLNVYPENIKAGLEKEELLSLASGRFLLSTQFDHDQNQYLELKVELRNGINPTSAHQEAITECLFTTLRQVNAEYKMLSDTLGRQAQPRVEICPYGDPVNFPPKIKEHYIKKA